MARTAFYKMLVAVVAATAASLLLLLAPPAQARTVITVDTTKDEQNANGKCSLREAIQAANADAPSGACRGGSGKDTIVFGVRGKITLGSMLPTVTDRDGLTIDGRNKDITVSGDDKVRILRVGDGAPLDLRNLTLANARAPENEKEPGELERSGAIRNYGGTLTVLNSTFSGNRAGEQGGAIDNEYGTLTVKGSTFLQNISDRSGGGAIGVDGHDTVTVVQDSTFSGNSGGAIGFNPGGKSTLTVLSSTFSENSDSAIRWEGHDPQAKLTVLNSTFSENSGVGGGGIYAQNEGTVTVSNSTFSGNNATFRGGGIYSEAWLPGSLLLTVRNSTFSGNSAEREGGGIYNSGRMTVTNSTFSDNSAGEAGGGIYDGTYVDCSTPPESCDANDGVEPSSIVHSTFSGNSAATGGGIFSDITTYFSGTTEPGLTETHLLGTILADSPQGGNCAESPDGTISDKGYNIDDGTSCGLEEANDSKPNTDPQLDPDGLSENGGRTKTIALRPGSPAIDAIAQDVCPPPNTDQRGVRRPQDGDGDGTALCDIGAFEVEEEE